MTPMAPTRPNRPVRPLLAVGKRKYRIRLMADLAAAAAARTEVAEAIRAWRVPVDPDVAVLLTSELVANAITHGTGPDGDSILLTVACDSARLRVDVHDDSGDLPVLSECLLDAETESGRGLLLVTSLSAEWGFYPTAAGKAVYFTLEFPAAVHEPASSDSDIIGPRSVS
jgi:anti-sigma regulatory factor (Ser/Thr protein kinase)